MFIPSRKPLEIIMKKFKKEKTFWKDWCLSGQKG